MPARRSSLGALGLVLGALLAPTAALAQPPPTPAPPPPPPAPPAPPPTATQPPIPPSPPQAEGVPAPAPAAGMQPPPPSMQPMPPPPPPWPWPPAPPPPPYPPPVFAGAPPPPPPPPPPTAPVDGVTAKGLPLSERGGLVVDAAGLVGPRANVPYSAIDVDARLPIADRTFVDLTLPLGYGAIGNPMLGLRHVLRPAERMWVTLGGGLGLPLGNNPELAGLSMARAFWHYEELASQSVPIAARAAFEAHAGPAELRAEIAPAVGISIDSSTQHSFAFEHAVEVQVGHAIGGGLRYQGVAAAQTLGSGDDHYQGALEPFFRVVRDPLFARLGLLMPLDNPLGKPFENAWGARLVFGYGID